MISKEVRDKYIEDNCYYILRILAGDLLTYEEIVNGGSLLYEKYKDKTIVKELGTKTILVEIPELDYECLYVNGDNKYHRLGYIIRYSLYNSNPMKLARRRVAERLSIFKGLELKSNSDLYGVDDDGNLVDFIQFDDMVIQQQVNCILGTLMKKGDCMINRKKEHYAWIRISFGGGYLSVDKDMYNLLIEVGAEERSCRGCGVPMLGKNICPICRAKYTECNNCGELFPIEEGTLVRGVLLCKKCAKLPRCRGCGLILKDTTRSVCRRCSELHNILDYHSGFGRGDESRGSRFKVGLEVEKEDAEKKLSISNGMLIAQTGWVAEKDSSLGENGFELVSPIYPLNIAIIESKLNALGDLMNAKTTSHCGGHIHVSDTERVPCEILRDIRGYLPLLYGMYPKRANNEYCEAKEMGEYLKEGHRQAINIGRDTLEFRIFPAVRNINQLLFRLKIVKYMLENPEEDVSKVGEKLLDKSGELYDILSERISEKRIVSKARLFIDFANYLERDGLMLNGNKIKRVVEVSDIKKEKDKKLDNLIRAMSGSIRRENSRMRTGGERTLERHIYGYFADEVGGGEEVSREEHRAVVDEVINEYVSYYYQSPPGSTHISIDEATRQALRSVRYVSLSEDEEGEEDTDLPF